MGRSVWAHKPVEWEARLIDLRDGGTGSADFHRLDVTDLDALKRALEGVDAVIHLAAIPSPYHGNDEQLFRANVQGTFNVMLACEAHGIGKVVYASSICYYGLLFRREMLMPAYLPLDEDHPSHPQDGYSLSKRIGEEIMRAFVQRTGGAVASLRYCYLAPTGAAKGVAPALSQPQSWAMSLFTYVDIEDAARVTWRALEHVQDKRGLYEAFQISADDTLMPEPTAELVHQWYPGVADLRFDGKLAVNRYATLYSNDKARRVLGFEPSRPAWRTAPTPP